MQLNKLLPIDTMSSAKEHSFHCHFPVEIILYKIFLVFYIHSFIRYIPKHSDSNIQTSSTPNFLHQAMKFAVLSLATKEHGWANGLYFGGEGKSLSLTVKQNKYYPLLILASPRHQTVCLVQTPLCQLIIFQILLTSDKPLKLIYKHLISFQLIYNLLRLYARRKHSRK